MVNIHNKKIKNHPVFILTPSMLPSMAAARWLEGVCVWGGGMVRPGLGRRGVIRLSGLPAATR